MVDIHKLLTTNPLILSLLHDLSPEILMSIEQYGTEIVLYRDSVALDPQNVIFAHNLRRAEDQQNFNFPTGISAGFDIAVIGVKDHYELADFDVARQDMFTYNGTDYEVIYVDKSFIGRIVATCTVRQ